MPSARWAPSASPCCSSCIVPLVCGEYTLTILNLILLAVVGAIGLNILVGYTDQVSIGQGAFMSVGAYTAAHLITQLDAPFWIAVPAGGLMAAVIGALVGIPSLRIKGLYLAIATLAAQLIIQWTINHVTVHFRRQRGNDPGAAAGGVRHRSCTVRLQMYLFLMFFVVLAMVAAQNLIRSRIGRAFIAIRDQDIAAEIIGINIFRYKLLGVRDLLVLRRRHRGAVHLLPRDRELRAIRTRRVDQLPGDGDHRRARLDRWGRSSARPSSRCCRSSRGVC